MENQVDCFGEVTDSNKENMMRNAFKKKRFDCDDKRKDCDNK